MGLSESRLRDAARDLLFAYDRSGLTALGWFAPYVEALREAVGAEDEPTSVAPSRGLSERSSKT